MRTLRIETPLYSRDDFFAAVGQAAADAGHPLPPPPNLDALADAVRELDVESVTATDCSLPDRDVEAVTQVLDDAGVTARLHRPDGGRRPGR